MTYLFGDKRALIVEDEYILALNLATEVTARGAVVTGPVGTVDGALEAIKSTDVDGAILDIDLKARESFPVADALADRHVPFVFATGYEIANGITGPARERSPVRKTYSVWRSPAAPS